MRKNFNGTQISQSVTITEQAGADIADCRNRIMIYDEDGNVVLAADGVEALARYSEQTFDLILLGG